jgi:hypothetical protein
LETLLCLKSKKIHDAQTFLIIGLPFGNIFNNLWMFCAHLLKHKMNKCIHMLYNMYLHFLVSQYSIGYKWLLCEIIFGTDMKKSSHVNEGPRSCVFKLTIHLAK